MRSETDRRQACEKREPHRGLAVSMATRFQTDGLLAEIRIANPIQGGNSWIRDYARCLVPAMS
jgi:hypothetical protein